MLSQDGFDLLTCLLACLLACLPACMIACLDNLCCAARQFPGFRSLLSGFIRFILLFIRHFTQLFLIISFNPFTVLMLLGGGSGIPAYIYICIHGILVYNIYINTSGYVYIYALYIYMYITAYAPIDPCIRCEVNGVTREGLTAMHLAAQRGHGEVLRCLLKAGGRKKGKGKGFKGRRREQRFWAPKADA